MAEDITRQQHRIVSAAVKLFRKLGYEKTTVDDICKEADIARSQYPHLSAQSFPQAPG